MNPVNQFSPSFWVWITCSDGSHEQRSRTMSNRDKEYYTEERDGKLWLLSEAEARRRAWDRLLTPSVYAGMADTGAWMKREILKQNTEQYEYQAYTG